MVRSVFLAIAALVAMATGPLAAQDFPELTGQVVDAADILSASEEAALSTKLETVETETQRQLVIATIPDLQGYDIADFGYQLGREWGIGDAERNDGALLIVAPNERKVRIEVGYGLEGILTDAASSNIIQRSILPLFKAGDMPGGIAAGTDAMIAQLSLTEDQVRAQAASRAEDEEWSTRVRIIVAIVIMMLPTFIVTIPLIYLAKKATRNRRKWKSDGKGGKIYTSSSRSYGGYSGSSSSSSFSGGGGSFGGGGSSGSW
ncbi:methanol dehydrogenase [Erythrobacter jejuensis]|uniref:Methanol dehydrogenase n=2 Tax=Parerythrobacter jejuensis TaxID=795812 RepID=A0A845ATI2_9SPHN|nr:methanol dehydrogenase [Parerythrobacter jejuensis]